MLYAFTEILLTHVSPHEKTISCGRRSTHYYPRFWNKTLDLITIVCRTSLESLSLFLLFW